MTSPLPGWHPDPDHPGDARWWDGVRWTHHRPLPPAQRTVPLAANGVATASLVLGASGFVLMGIPFFIGLVFGGVPDALAIVFGIIGLGRAGALAGAGRGAAIAGIVLGALSLLSVGLGAGWLW